MLNVNMDFSWTGTTANAVIVSSSSSVPSIVTTTQPPPIMSLAGQTEAVATAPPVDSQEPSAHTMQDQTLELNETMEISTVPGK